MLLLALEGGLTSALAASRRFSLGITGSAIISFTGSPFPTSSSSLSLLSNRLTAERDEIALSSASNAASSSSMVVSGGLVGSNLSVYS